MVLELLNCYKNKEVNQQAAVELTGKVRDISFALGADGNIESLLEDRVGGCARKHLYLMPRLKQLGYRVSLGIARFDWRDLPIPSEILALLKSPIQHHLFLYVGFNNPENAVDITWDKGMKSLGFPVSNWDGISPTGISVKPIRVNKISPLILNTRSYVSSTLKQLKNLANQPTPFNDAFNSWLAGARD